MSIADDMRNTFNNHMSRDSDLDSAYEAFRKKLPGWIESNLHQISVKDAEILLESLVEQIRNENPVSIPRLPGDAAPINLPAAPQSPWRTYTRNLKKKGWADEGILNLGNTCGKFMASLSTEQDDPPVRELVIGRVQSGKTASMAGLIALAADQGFNLVVVLSGTIDSLRIQTEERLANDFTGCRSVKVYKSKLSRNTTHNPNQLLIKDTILVHVCLKNGKRLADLLAWIIWAKDCSFPVKMLVIDDECDQAGVNTAKVDLDKQTKINQAIKDIVHLEGINCSYVAYTATPYANILNESPDRDAEKSLYPRHRIHILEPGKGYQGCEAIYGREEDDNGQHAIAESKSLEYITESDLELIRHTHAGADIPVDGSLLQAIIWFVYCVAARRKKGSKSPVTMLVHTSQRQAHHKVVFDAIHEFLKNLELAKVIDEIVGIHSKAISNTESKYHDQLPDPLNVDFDFLKQVYKGVPSSGNSTDFGTGIHLCLDNAASQIRLKYPDNTVNLDFAPAFIVVGGNTLARGLTLEGLVSSFFLRAAGAADSLMQMGRWFGYRAGYEALPRIWNTKETVEQFRFLSRVEYELRNDISKNPDIQPQKMGSKILSNEEKIKLTAANKMQDACNQINFGMDSPQTIHLPRDKKILDKNLAATREFAKKIVSFDKSENNGSTIFNSVPVSMISGLIQELSYPQQEIFNESKILGEWLVETSKRCNWNPWNVAFIGPKTAPDSSPLEDMPFTWNKTNRSAIDKQTTENKYYIKALRGPVDVGIDLFDSSIKRIKARNEVLNGNPQPLLLLYVIDRNSYPKKTESKDRIKLEAEEDIIGLSLIWPTSKMVTNNYLTIRLAGNAAKEGDLAETENDEPLEEVE